MQLQYPVVVLAFEKLLIGCCLPVAATVQAWGVIAALGLAPAPFYLCPILAVLYCLFGMPLASSFAAGSHRNSIGQLYWCSFVVHLHLDRAALSAAWHPSSHQVVLLSDMLRCGAAAVKFVQAVPQIRTEFILTCDLD